jgi:hypothetical protein
MLFGDDKKADAVIAKTISMAEEGDTACIRLCLDRIAPPRKDRPVRFTLPEMREARDALNASPSRPVKPATGSEAKMTERQLTRLSLEMSSSETPTAPKR